MTTSDSTGDLMAGSNDLLMIYSNGSIPGWHSTRLLDEEMVQMASPTVAVRLEGYDRTPFAALRGSGLPPLLDYVKGSPEWIDWQAWFGRLRIEGPDGWRVRRMSTYSQTIGEAIRGEGVALGSVALLRSELDSGRLVPIGTDVLRTD